MRIKPNYTIELIKGKWTLCQNKLPCQPYGSLVEAVENNPDAKVVNND